MVIFIRGKAIRAENEVPWSTKWNHFSDTDQNTAVQSHWDSEAGKTEMDRLSGIMNEKTWGTKVNERSLRRKLQRKARDTRGCFAGYDDYENQLFNPQ
ncbi:hypothetical protein TNCV_516011 [Trichonephila clavipes]|nr:hypothetical protein TNCV_516011 [Trichonephila clavipes]